MYDKKVENYVPYVYRNKYVLSLYVERKTFQSAGWWSQNLNMTLFTKNRNHNKKLRYKRELK